MIEEIQSRLQQVQQRFEALRQVSLTYEKSDSGYTVVPPTAGSVVENLPEGGEEVKIGDVTYVKLGEVYYQGIEKDGKNMYEVVNVEKVEG